jgi:hypothetical protein
LGNAIPETSVGGEKKSDRPDLEDAANLAVKTGPKSTMDTRAFLFTLDRRQSAHRRISLVVMIMMRQEMKKL